MVGRGARDARSRARTSSSLCAPTPPASLHRCLWPRGHRRRRCYPLCRSEGARPWTCHMSSRQVVQTRRSSAQTPERVFGNVRSGTAGAPWRPQEQTEASKAMKRLLVTDFKLPPPRPPRCFSSSASTGLLPFPCLSFRTSEQPHCSKLISIQTRSSSSHRTA